MSRRSKRLLLLSTPSVFQKYFELLPALLHPLLSPSPLSADHHM